MKKEYCWFFIFILAAALLSGSTLSFYANFKYISQQSKLQQEQPQKHSEEKSSASSSADSTTVAKQKLADNGTSPSNNNYLSPAEQEEINVMLEAMGSASMEFTLQIKEFQQKNSLPVTGIMDTETLNLIINKATLQKAVQHLNN